VKRNSETLRRERTSINGKRQRKEKKKKTWKGKSRGKNTSKFDKYQVK
jgi:hypothetical protein